MATKSVPSERAYNCNDVEVLTVSNEIITAAQSLLPEIVQSRPNWADPFFPNIRSQIDHAFVTHLGVKNTADLRTKSAVLHSIMSAAQADLILFKVDLDNDFRANPGRATEIENILGYDLHWEGMVLNSPVALIGLVHSFKKNLTAALEAEILAAGMDLDVMPRIINFAAILEEANIDMEFTKALQPISTDQAIDDFNLIYDLVNSISSVLQVKYRSDELICNQFSFSAVLKNLHNHRGEPAPVI